MLDNLYHDLYEDPWGNVCVYNTYHIRVDQISDMCRKVIRKRIYSAIEEFDRNSRKQDNLFRMIKEDFNPVYDIKILFEDGEMLKNTMNIGPKEEMEKCKKAVEEIEPYLK